MKKKSFAKKSLGQNFLQSSKVRDRILESVGDLKDKNILEIGPGLGFLTNKLIAKKANVTAIELDERAVEILQKDFGHRDNFHLIHGDFLKQDLDKLFEQKEPALVKMGNKKYSIIANIPYNITSPILKKVLANTTNKPESMTLMVQKEVGKKICPHGKNFKRSILSLSVEIFAEAELLFLVDRENFSPVPKVDSAIIQVRTRPEPLVTPEMERDFFTVVHAGFSSKRKKLGNVIGSFFGIESNKILGNIDPNRRAETLNVDEWIDVTKNFQNNG
jgi:16S rRNA (adenine1518-N6/adenine1519-N6)-dimethyltransferase